MWCVHLNLSWQTETILTRSKLSKMHLLLDPLQVRRSTTGTWYSPDQTCKGQFCHGCGLNGVFKGSMFKIRLNDEQNHCFVSYTFAHFFWGKAHWDATKKAPSAWTSWLKSRWDNSLCYTEMLHSRLRSLVSIGISVDLWVLSANTTPWHQTVRQIQCGSFLVLCVDDVSITLFCFCDVWRGRMEENKYCLKSTLIIKSDHESMLEVSRWVW